MPQHHMVIPHYMGKSKAKFEGKIQTENHRQLERQDSFSSPLSAQDIPLLVPQEGEEHQTLNGFHKEDIFQNASGNARRTEQNVSFSLRRDKSESFNSDMPMKGFVDEMDSIHHKKNFEIMSQDQEWWETQERRGQIISSDEIGQVGPCTPCHCQVCFFAYVIP